MNNDWQPIATAPKDCSFILGEEATGVWWLVYWDTYAEAWRDQFDCKRKPIKWYPLPLSQASDE